MQEFYAEITNPSQETLYKTLETLPSAISFHGDISLYYEGMSKEYVNEKNIEVFLKACKEKELHPLGIQFEWARGFFLPRWDYEQERPLVEKLRREKVFQEGGKRSLISSTFLNKGRLWSIKINLVGFKEMFQWEDLYEQVLVEAKSQGYQISDMDLWLRSTQAGPDSGSQSPVEELTLYGKKNLSLFSRNQETQQWFDSLEKKCRKYAIW